MTVADPPIISAFNWVPDFAKGRVRDLRVRWAFEEIGQGYRTHLLDTTRPRGADYVRWQPFDQVPAFRDAEVEMFESGAILLRIGERDERLLPCEEQARWQAISWLFAALSSVEPALMQLVSVKLFHGEAPWTREAQSAFRPFAEKRLGRLAAALGDRDWLAGRFSIADIVMATVLDTADALGLLEAQPTLAAYRERAKARPAFERAIAAQMDDFTAEPTKQMEGA